MVHASMRAVGGRAEDLVEALCSSAAGVVMLVCNDEDQPYAPDVRAWGELGVLAEVFRTAPGVVCNDHPVARFAGWGRGQAVIRDAPLDDYYGPGSPLARLVSAGGCVLRLGADEDTVTLFHHAEYLARVVGKRRVTRTVETVDGPVQVSCLDDDEGIVDWEGEDYFSLILADYLATGRAWQGTVGGARAELLDARDAVAFAVDWMERELG